MQELAALESLDNGKPFGMACFDIMTSVNILRYYAGWTEKLQGITIPMTGPFLGYTKSDPVGVCGQIVPWNFPALMATFKLAPVLATGCTAVLKPAENTSLTALRMAQIFQEVGGPEGVINVLPGLGSVAGEALVQHEDVDKIAFTGSTATGKHILRESSYTLKRVGLELGGKSPNIIMDDADIELALEQSNFACFLNNGQFCMAGTRVFVHEKIYDKFVERAVEMAKTKRLGDPFEDGIQNGPVISQVQLDKVLNYIEIGQKEGATLQCGGKRLDRNGYFVDTTIFSDVTDDMTIAKEEIFGPVMSIMKFKDIDEVISRANASKYGLVSGVVTQSLQSAIKISNKMKSGQVYVNCWAAIQPSTPFGGFKESGIGRELGQKSLDGYLETKAVMIKYSP